MAQEVTLATRKAKSRGRADRAASPRSAGEELDAWEARTTEREVAALSGVHEAVAGVRSAGGPGGSGRAGRQLRARIIRVAVAETQKCSAAWTRASLLWERAPGHAGHGGRGGPGGAGRGAGGRGAGVGRGPGPGPGPGRGRRVRLSGCGPVMAGRSSPRRGPSGTPRRRGWTWRSTWWPRRAARYRSWSPRHQTDVALAGPDLGADQAEVAAGLLTARTAVSVLVAPAGAGKTHTVAAFARAWTGLHRRPGGRCDPVHERGPGDGHARAWPRRTTSPRPSAAARTAPGQPIRLGPGDVLVHGRGVPGRRPGPGRDPGRGPRRRGPAWSWSATPPSSGRWRRAA